MAGTLFGLGLSQQHDNNGRPLVKAKLYIFTGGTTTPATAYSNTGLSVSLPHPIEADANGRFPQFWLADGTYRVRMTTAGGVVHFDEDSVLAIGPSSGGGGGGGSTVDPNALFQTGFAMWQPFSGTLPGWVRHNGRTIGAGASGALERANADTQALFEFLWNGYLDASCPVSGGRGASAAADWAANKTIGTIDLRGRAMFGLDDMGGAAAGRLGGVVFTLGGPTQGASLGGASTVTLTVTETPPHTHGPGTLTGTTSSDGDHDHGPVSGGSFYTNNAGGTFSSGAGFNFQTTGLTTTNGAHTHTASMTAGVTGSTGAGAAHANMPPFALGTHFVKL